MSRGDAQPSPLPGLPALEEGDFHGLSEGLSRDPQYNDRRLLARRKLAAIARAAVERVAAETSGEVALEARTSLHNPHAFNHMRVRRLWAYVCRDKASKRKLRGVLGADLAKDLDASYRNAYLCVALEAEAVEVSLRIHPDAWFDGQNLVNRVKREGVERWTELLNALPGRFLRLDDWKGEWRCGELARDRVEEFLRYYVPGELGLAIERRWPAPAGARGAVLDEDVPARLVDELAALAPMYRYLAWSAESDFLFAR